MKLDFKLDVGSIRSLIEDVMQNALEVKHTRRSLIEHLLGTYKILEQIGVSDNLKIAGAVHNVYGTEKFVRNGDSLVSRSYLQSKIGIDAETIVFLFSRLNWEFFLKGPPIEHLNVDYSSFFHENVKVNQTQFSDIVLLFFANIVEQVNYMPQKKIKLFGKLAFEYQAYMDIEQLTYIQNSLNVESSIKGACMKEDVLNYKNNDILEAFCKNYRVEMDEAQDIFQQLLKWFIYCDDPRTTEHRNIDDATLIIDEMWHTFILFTPYYSRFCEKYFGRYIHHMPSTNEVLSEQRKRSLEEVRKYKKEQYALVYDILGEETFVKWYHEYPQKYSIESLNRLKVAEIV